MSFVTRELPTVGAALAIVNGLVADGLFAGIEPDNAGAVVVYADHTAEIRLDELIADAPEPGSWAVTWNTDNGVNTELYLTKVLADKSAADGVMGLDNTGPMTRAKMFELYEQGDYPGVVDAWQSWMDMNGMDSVSVDLLTIQGETT